ncbi:SLATT domain-containing protein [Flavobacterium sp. xlx-214]|uniref:SLATT domain-containing protein n=1 Tax=unclassified Flavobacterium TaxID=196869 RepID=UPI0013D81036|nr:MULTISPECIES: SLATT domain-containing protein [unclassified Flavobacterium]MBA5791557.1 SLATT domain-containing protein [Flavobacterium sp. xlx-221]QMI82808.1 SLATT domain-containing protein [Flavobacterium sp. xlx-214]
MTKSTTETTSGQLYLNKDFSVELNYKFWTTKGARFTASSRLKKINRLSSYSIGFLSGYMIIIGLLSVFKLNNDQLIPSNQLGFITTGLSILILVFSQLESANDYALKADKFHNCALEIGELYNKLRYLKTNFKNEQEINSLAEELSIEYGNVLKKYENHEPIDFEYFKTSKNDYFKLSRLKVFKIQCEYYFKTKFLYHFLIIAPALIIYMILKW